MTSREIAPGAKKLLAKLSHKLDNTSDAARTIGLMSPFTRYAFALFICIYGIYQMINGHFFPGIVGLLLAVFIAWLGGRR